MASGVDDTVLEESAKDPSNKPAEDPSNESGPHINPLLPETSNADSDVPESAAVLETSQAALEQEFLDRYAHCYDFLKRDYHIPSSRRPLRLRPVVNFGDGDIDAESYLASLERVEKQATFWGKAIDWYFKHAHDFRTSKCTYILPFLYSAVFISSIVMGLTYIADCSGYKDIPYIGAVAGVYGVVSMVIWTIYCFRVQSEKRCRGRLYDAFVISMMVLFAILFVDMAFVFAMKPSYEPSQVNYCNRTFYLYSFYKQFVTCVGAIFVLIVYIPPFRHDLSCKRCIRTRSRPFEFYESM